MPARYLLLLCLAGCTSPAEPNPLPPQAASVVHWAWSGIPQTETTPASQTSPPCLCNPCQCADCPAPFATCPTPSNVTTWPDYYAIYAQAISQSQPLLVACQIPAADLPRYHQQAQSEGRRFCTVAPDFQFFQPGQIYRLNLSPTGRYRSSLRQCGPQGCTF